MEKIDITKNHREEIENILRELNEKYESELPFSKPADVFDAIKDKDFFEQKVLLEKGIEKNIITAREMEICFQSATDNAFKMALLENYARFTGREDQEYSAEILNNELSKAFSDDQENAALFLNEIKEPEKTYLLEKFGSDTNDLMFNASVKALGEYGKYGEKILLNFLQPYLDEPEINSATATTKFKRESNFKQGIGAHQDFASPYSRQTKKLSQKENLEELSAQKDKEGDEINFEGRWNEDVDYPYNSEILKQLAKTGSHESIDFCLNLLEKSSDMASIYKTELENILQNIDADYSTEKLIEIFKSGEKDEIKNRSAKMLFRLELSKVGTAENDLAFLDKWFDNLEPAAVKNIFSRYVDILSLSANAKEEIKNHFKKDANFSETETEKISANLLRKADDLLAGFGKGGKISAEEVLKELDKYQADSVFLLELFKTIKENETTDIKFEDIKGINLEKKSGTEVLQNDFPALAEIYRKNYDADPALADQLIERFEKILQDKNGSAYILKKGEKIIAFSASQTIGEGKKFAAAMNIDPEWRGSGIGALFVQETMKKESENSDIAADFNADLPVSSFYLGPKVRFAANKFIPNYKESGKKFFEAEIKNGQKYSYQNLSAEELKKSAVEAAPAADKFILKIPRKNYPAVMEEMINKKGYKLTRYINEASDDYIYGAFEKI